MNPVRIRNIAIVAATVLTALSVMACGIVGWVGLVIPHICRRVVGVDHARLLPAACFTGAIFLALVDICARSLLAAELPIGILTALLGAPFFCLSAEAYTGERGGLVMITVKQAAFSYDGRNELFSDLSFSLAAGEILTILGRNGIGKTTFLRCLLGILPWTHGECLVGGKRPDPAVVSDVIGYVPQSHAPAFPYTVFEMVMMGRARRIGLFRTPAAADRARVAELLDMVGILPLADRAATALSGGQLQMVYIARALAVEPKLIILDEPEAHLDFHNQMIVLRLLKKLSTEQHMTIVMNTHSPENALKISDKSLLMRRGEHLFGPTESLLTEENLRRFYDIDCRITETRIGDVVHRGLLTLL